MMNKHTPLIRPVGVFNEVLFLPTQPPRLVLERVTRNLGGFSLPTACLFSAGKVGK
tara:strand:+ start:3900 stop:4067 length:168 start_codon:yes stop_codon:yes gene_type:complete